MLVTAVFNENYLRCVALLNEKNVKVLFYVHKLLI